MKRMCAVWAMFVLIAAAFPSGAAFELRTWATTSAAPADGSSHSTSTSFQMVSRLGGPFVGSAESPSFALWGCSVTPVEGAFFAMETEPLCVTLRWTVESLGGITGFNVYRGASEAGPFQRINEEVIPAQSPGVFEDRTVWPGSPFWYELRGVMAGGVEDIVGDQATLVTGGTLETRLYSATPNPFHETTSIQLDVANTAGGVRLVIYDIAGRVVRTFDGSVSHPGRYELTWDGTNDRGQRIASGVYFCVFESAGGRQTNRLVYLR